jgi:HAD superfamily hydrolase (TIGR01509 family)
MKIQQVIFDCDGVLVDSEIISNRIEAEYKTELGYPIDLKSQLKSFVGLSATHPIIIKLFEQLPVHYRDEVKKRVWEMFRTELKSIPYVKECLYQLKLPYCIASASSYEKIDYMLGLTDLKEFFSSQKIYTCQQVKKPKPDPEIYLWISDQLKIKPEHCLVIEDSLVGVQAASQAGMNVYAFNGGSHASIYTFKEYQESGAIHVFSDLRELQGMIEYSNQNG